MLQQLAVTADDAAGIAEVRAATRLRMPDAIVLYTAERHGAELVTTDRVLARAATERSVPATLLRP
jgi:predicted nucleic acid-binding protein